MIFTAPDENTNIFLICCKIKVPSTLNFNSKNSWRTLEWAYSSVIFQYNTISQDNIKIFRNGESILTHWCRSVQAWTFFAIFHKNEGVPLNQLLRWNYQNHRHCFFLSNTANLKSVERKADTWAAKKSRPIWSKKIRKFFSKFLNFFSEFVDKHFFSVIDF